MQEGPANVQVTLLAFHEQHHGDAVDHHADAGHHNHHKARDFSRIAEPLEGFPGDTAHRGNQNQGIEQGCQDGGFLQAIGFAGGGRFAGKPAGGPGQEQAHHITQVVPGIGNQRQGAGQHAVHRFNHYKQGVQDHRNGKGAVVGVELVAVIVAVAMVVAVHGFLVRGMFGRRLSPSGPGCAGLRSEQ